MTNAVFIKRLFAGVLLFTALLVVGLPWALYWVGLSGIRDMPTPPSTIASTQDVQKVWQKARGTGEPVIEPISPLGYAHLIYEGKKQKPGLLVTWWVASANNLDHLKYRGMGWWHLSGTALTIWLSRNWSSEQIFSKAVEIEHGRAKEPNKPI